MDYYHYTGDQTVLSKHGSKVASILEQLFVRTVPFHPGQVRIQQMRFQFLLGFTRSKRSKQHDWNA